MAGTGQHPWLHPGWKIQPTRIGYCSNANCARRFRCEDNNIALTQVQPHFYRERQVEPCHQLGRSSQALILSILALGAMPKQQQPPQPNQDTTTARPLLPKPLGHELTMQLGHNKDSSARSSHDLTPRQHTARRLVYCPPPILCITDS